ncbi:hypothetical protein OPQ81_011678 [Rhizoctonia solani]|nr:hypothetical protein OPQ81_011678 [Rhizoctonia solani]
MLGGSYQGSGPYLNPTRPQADAWGNRSPQTLFMLVMGPQGSGKSSFINMAISRPDCQTSTDSRLCTQIVRFCKWSSWISGGEFKFTDTPGFGNGIIDDKRILELLVENLAPNARRDRHDSSNLPRRVAGLLYIHSEDEPFRSRTPRKTIEMLVKILGERFLERVTVLIYSKNMPQYDFSSFTPPEDSPLYPLYSKSIKPWTMSYGHDLRSLERILGPYVGLRPRLVRLAALDNFVQSDGGNWQFSDIPRHLEEFLSKDTTPPVMADQADIQSRLKEQEKEIEKLRKLLAQREAELQELQTNHGELKRIQKDREEEKFNHETERKSLCNTIQGLKGEISNLTSSKDSELKELEALKNAEISKLSTDKDLEIKQLQDKLQAKADELTTLQTDSKRRIQESIDALRTKEDEINELKSGLNGATIKKGKEQNGEISRLEGEIRRTQAEYASLRTHMQLEENTEQADITTALADINRLIEEFGHGLSEHIEKHMKENSSGKTFQPQDLLSLLGPIGSEGVSRVKQDAYALFEYSVQATVCDLLCTHLFRPFHPSIADDEKRDAFITRLYEQVAYQGPQSVAGRWRKDAFNSISRDQSSGSQHTPDDNRMHRIITGALSKLLGKVVEIGAHEVLGKHDRELLKVISKAEDLNRLLKGGVAMLGDFEPTVFPFGEKFQPDYMSEVNSKSKKAKHPETILATTELGLVKIYAVGGGRKPERTVLRKAAVIGLPK